MDDNRIYYTVYCTTNLVNGKIYIGVHKTTDIYDSYLGSGAHINRAIKKHGRHNFQKEIIFFAFDENSMYWAERQIVNDEWVAREDTYNISVGGYGGQKKSKETKNRRETHTQQLYENVVKHLHEARKSAGMTQRDLAAELHVTHSWIAKVELSVRRIDVVETIKWIEATGNNPINFFMDLFRTRNEMSEENLP